MSLISVQFKVLEKIKEGQFEVVLDLLSKEKATNKKPDKVAACQMLVKCISVGKNYPHQLKRRLDVINTLLTKFHADPNHVVKFNSTAIERALVVGDFMSIKILLEAGANVFVYDKNGRAVPKKVRDNMNSDTFLDLFVRLAKKENEQVCFHILKAIIEHIGKQGGVLVPQFINSWLLLTGNNRTAISLLSELGKWRLVKLLLEQGANVNQCIETSHHPLHFAVNNGDVNAVGMLLEHGQCAQHIINLVVCRVLQVNMPNARPMIQKMLRGVDCKAEVGEQAVSILHIACGSIGGNADLVIDRCDDVDFISGKRPVTPLFIAARIGVVAVAKRLVEKGADPNFYSDDYDSTPLIQAAHFGHSDMVRYLISCGANVNFENQAHLTVAIVANQAGHAQLSDYLRRIRGKAGDDAIHGAIIAGRLDKVNAIVQADATAINRKLTHDHSTPLLLLAQRPLTSFTESHLAIAKFLLDQGADAYAITKKTQANVLILACEQNDFALVELLLNHPHVDAKRLVQQFAADNCTALHTVMGGKIEINNAKRIINLLVTIDPSIVNEVYLGSQYTALRLAVYLAPKLIPVLLAVGCDVNCIPGEDIKISPVYNAISEEKTDALKSLLEGNNVNLSLFYSNGRNLLIGLCLAGNNYKALILLLTYIKTQSLEISDSDSQLIKAHLKTQAVTGYYLQTITKLLPSAQMHSAGQATSFVMTESDVVAGQSAYAFVKENFTNNESAALNRDKTQMTLSDKPNNLWSEQATVTSVWARGFISAADSRVKLSRNQPDCYLYVDEQALEQQGCDCIDEFVKVEPVFDKKHVRILEGKLFTVTVQLPNSEESISFPITHELKISQEKRVFIFQLKSDNSNASLYWACKFASALHTHADQKSLQQSTKVIRLFGITEPPSQLSATREICSPEASTYSLLKINEL